MSCWAIVAINTRLRRKRRLRGELDEAARDALARQMLGRVLAAVEATPSIARVLLVSPDQDGLPDRWDVLLDAGTGLNDAFALARSRARARQAHEIVLLPADLPRLDAADIEALVVAGRDAGIAIAPDRTGHGTNGLYLPAGLDFICRFGARSRVRHEAEARRFGIEPAIVVRPGLASDLDTPADLRALAEAGGPRDGPSPRAERCA